LVPIIAIQALSACGGGSGAAAGDGGTESGGSDAGTTSDVGTTSDAGARTSFCSPLSPPPTLCSDFDEGPGSLTPWTIRAINGFGGSPDAGAIALDPSTFVSPPASLHEATYPAEDAGDAYTATISKNFGVAVSEVTFASDVLVPAGGSRSIVELDFLHPDGTFDAVNLALRGGVFQDIPLGDASAATQQVKSFSLDAGVPTGAWHRFALDVAVGPPATVSLTIDSTAVIDAGALDPASRMGSWWRPSVPLLRIPRLPRRSTSTTSSSTSSRSPARIARAGARNPAKEVRAPDRGANKAKPYLYGRRPHFEQESSAPASPTSNNLSAFASCHARLPSHTWFFASPI
jgi:hypothetical protein